jgi:hypothetical protein
MRWNLFLGALVVSAGLSSQSFGFELLDRMLGLNGCGGNSCCQPQCCEKSCCAPACEPACAAPACAPACAAPACEPTCCEQPACNTGCGCGQGNCCQGNVKCGCSHWGVRTCHSHDLFAGLRGLFDCNRGCCNSGCNNGCGCAEATCFAQPVCEQTCSAQPACEQSCCNNGCGHHRAHRACLLDIFGRHRRCCQSSCCQSACEASCGCAGGACAGGVGAPGAPMPPAPGAGAPTDAAPMPPAPMADPQASMRSQRRILQASKIVRAN